MKPASWFLAELRRRNVYRAAVIYAGAAWLLVQVATQVFPFFHFPEWVVRWIVVAAIIAAPFVLLAAWFYEWTPTGIRLEGQVQPGASITRQTGKKLDRGIIAVLSLVVVVLLTDRFILHRGSQIAERSIAVLPLVNATGDPADEYFSDGIAEELIFSLSRLSLLKVIGRTSSFQFKNRSEDSKAIGEKLGVTYLLEGSVRKTADRVRITVALIRAADGTSIWADIYERESSDIFAMQSEISSAVASQLKVALLGKNQPATQSSSPSEPTNHNFDAYKALLQGNFYQQRRTADDFRKSIAYYEEAIRFDPAYALAYARMSASIGQLAGLVPVAEGRALYVRARQQAEQALALDPGLSEGHYARGRVLLQLDLDFAGTRAAYQRALELSPQDPRATLALSTMEAEFGDLEAAVQGARRSLDLDPLRGAALYNLALFYTALGRHDEAEGALNRAIELQPQAAQNHAQLALIRILRGDLDAALEQARLETDPFWRIYAMALVHTARNASAEADAALKKLIDEDADDAGSQIATIYALRRDPDRMFQWLEHAWVTRDPGVSNLLYDPLLLRYKDDPRFAAFAQKIGVLAANNP